MAHLYSSTYSKFTIHFVQKKEAKLPYYGPIIRGWIGSKLYKNKKLFKSVFKPEYTDVKPYFLYTQHSGKNIYATLSFLGEPKSFIAEVSKTLSSEFVTNIGGIPAKIEKIEYSLEDFIGIEVDDKLKIKFISPTSIESQVYTNIVPSLEDILNATVRSANRYLKFFAPEIYPLRVRSTQVKDILKSFSIDTFTWRHRRKNGGEIPLEGITGEITYEIDGEIPRDLGKILGLTSFFQIGKRVGYGFGKLEVHT